MKGKCTLCPRNCGVDRSIEKGYCKMPDKIYAARASLHMWEEPCISGKNGSGTVFFSGCTMKCVYCQNRHIAADNFGKEVSKDRLADIFLELQSKNAHNINLVTPTHYADKIADALIVAKSKGLIIPVVYNTSGYETKDTLLMLKDLVDIFMPDFKYWSQSSAKKYSNAPDYPEVAKKAVETMVGLQPKLIYDKEGMLKKGVIIRHLLLPGYVYEAKRIAEYILTTYGDRVILSLMSQYTPMVDQDKFPELCRKVKKKEYDSLLDFAIELGDENIYIQEGTSADESFIPPFTLEGI